VNEAALLDRAKARLLRRADVRGEDDCWLWTDIVSPGGYGTFAIRGKNKNAHRWAYILFVGSVPDGYEVDHLCRVKLCVNPRHLQAIPKAANLAQRIWPAPSPCCPSGHLYDDRNTGRTKRGSRYCRACARDRMAEKRLVGVE
jgi:hypothetical protein